MSCVLDKDVGVGSGNIRGVGGVGGVRGVRDDAKYIYDYDTNINMRINPMFDFKSKYDVPFAKMDLLTNKEYYNICDKLHNIKKEYNKSYVRYQTGKNLLLVKSEGGLIFYLERYQAIDLEAKLADRPWSIAWKHIRSHLYDWGTRVEGTINFLILNDYQFRYINDLRMNAR